MSGNNYFNKVRCPLAYCFSAGLRRSLMLSISVLGVAIPDNRTRKCNQWGRLWLSAKRCMASAWFNVNGYSIVRGKGGRGRSRP